MSKASDYAEAVRGKPVFECDHIGKMLRVGQVGEKGDLVLPPHSEYLAIIISPSDALRLAEWLVDVFGEKDDG